ncbi:hypothetical protein [Parasediminibacterium sp. JCM 36343]|uniref:hypothetical protein n=1 Tax=Parasediminibacterium sp. JCM 36343 TaxID=3374279 RepID=UPI00397D7C8F
MQDISIPIIITICGLLLVAYIFDLTAFKTKIPSVILLLVLGWGTRQGADMMVSVKIPNLSFLLPILGTLGLILIVLEGSLELELNKSKLPVLKKSFVVAFLPMLAISFLTATGLHYLQGFPFKDSLENIIPLCVISSAIAIPTARNLSGGNKEFITYESSMSDIIGVLFFNFIALNETISMHSVGHFFVELLSICVVTFAATVGLVFLLNKIDHHIKHIPIVILVILIYALSKIYHLPALVFILFFGLFLSNLDEIKQLEWISKKGMKNLKTEVHRFSEIVTEAAFLIRALFFILFGYLIEAKEILDTQTLGFAVGIVVGIFIIRAGVLKLAKLPVLPLLFIAPRGLITILLFLAIPASQSIAAINRSLVIQVIILTALIMMIGLMSHKVKEEEPVAKEAG